MKLKIETLGEVLHAAGDAPLAGHPLDGRPCHACEQTIRVGDRIAILDGGILHAGLCSDPKDYAVIRIAHAACAEDDPANITGNFNEEGEDD